MYTVGIDIDDTIVESQPRWEKHMGEQPENTIDDFFRQPDVYDNINIDSAIITHIKELSEICNIVFISACFDEHITSKKNMLERAFSSIQYDFINSRTKFEVPVDYMIDDREKVLDNMPVHVMCLKAKLPGVTSEKYKVLSWDKIYETIKKDINART